MKQKMVVKISMNGHKCRSKALKIAVGIQGVESAALQGQDKDQIVVTGDGVDAVVLTTSLRKGVGHAELVSVSPVKEGDKKEDGGSGGDQKKNEAIWQSVSGYYYPPQLYFHEVRDDRYDNNCSIM
ncbi:heavy metal-associated isoprenylated plant protein 47-like [Actinidia eriantha]|uniref:heavy metal-associated isoprenylated plant protein 47-like n=1 Tax=Actinidia eriantha TaxID=165200 RepID=UPI002588A662|nr:heavy metal-associated isoprenylated plant protein 47-like [Actinidia eriantha]